MRALDKLLGLKVSNIGRATDMLCVSFGDDVKTNLGISLPAYEIHCLCPWRIKTANDEILLASSEIYQPPVGEEWSEVFNWDVKGGNLFDQKVVELFGETDYYVADIRITECNDLIMKMSSGITLETFTDSSAEECWRLIERGDSASNSNYLVASAKCIHLE